MNKKILMIFKAFLGNMKLIRKVQRYSVKRYSYNQKVI